MSAGSIGQSAGLPKIMMMIAFNDDDCFYDFKKGYP